MAEPMSISPSPDGPALESFPLLALPVELVLLVVSHVDERPASASFPSGPPVDLLRLSETSRFFLSACRPRIWSAINYAPLDPDEQPYTAQYKQSRSLAELNEIVKSCAGHGSHHLFGPLPLVRLSIHGADEGVHQIDDFFAILQRHRPNLEPPHNEELDDTLQIIASLGESSMLQVLFLRDVMFSTQGAIDFLSTILERSPALSALRMNCCAGFAPTIDFNAFNLRTDNLRTIQVMHGSKNLVRLTRLAPNLESLLLWPGSRRLGSLGPYIASKMGQLRLLSIDAVHEAEVFALFANAIDDLHARNEPIPLEELFLEGPQAPAERDELICALRHSEIRRLALYHLRNATPAVVEDIVRAMPQLEALTLVQGDCSAAVQWPATLDQYTAQLRKLHKLKFFAFDRKSPQPESRENPARREKQMKLEYTALSAVGVACGALNEAVAIVEDVSEGSSGYFASFTREKGKVRIKLTARKVRDFLISFDRWCVVAE